MPSTAMAMATAVSGGSCSIELRALRSDFSRGRPGGRAWLAVSVGELVHSGVVYTDLDAHISVCYAYHEAAEKIDEIAECLQARLAALTSKKDFHHFRSKVASPHLESGENYAWCNISLHSSLHSMLKELTHDRKLALAWKNWTDKDNYHISFNSHKWDDLDEREAPECCPEPAGDEATACASGS